MRLPRAVPAGLPVGRHVAPLPPALLGDRGPLNWNVGRESTSPLIAPQEHMWGLGM